MSLCVLCVSVACTRKAATAPPLVAQVSGTLDVTGLSAPVRIVRDRWGVPHIYAQRQDDLFVAQGLVQAQDRLFQMDLWRRSVQGRLSEVLGPNFIARDAMTRRVQYVGDLDPEWASYGPDAKAIATSFVRGINAWVALARERPPEEFVLAGWKPEFWSPVDLLNRTDAFVESRKAIDLETWRPASAGPDAVALVSDAIRRIGTPPFFVGLAAPLGQVRLTASAEATAFRRSSERRWKPDTIDHTATDRLTTRLDHPSRYYLVHLNGPAWNAIGAAAPWLPGVAIGHNDRIAWDLAQVDVGAPSVDVVKTNPANPHQVDDGGRWIDTVIVKDVVVVKGRREPFAYETEYTKHGVIVATDRQRHLAFTIRWRGTEPGAIPALHALAADRAAASAFGFSRTDASPTVVFAHALGVTAEARSRFNVGPLPRPSHHLAAFQVSFEPSDWDRSTAMNAPGQSESPDSAHFSDLAPLWEDGKPFPLVFSDRAVQSAAETTLFLSNRSRAPSSPRSRP